MKNKNSKPTTADRSQLSAPEAAELAEACRMAIQPPNFDVFWEEVLAGARKFRAMKRRRQSRALGQDN